MCRRRVLAPLLGVALVLLAIPDASATPRVRWTRDAGHVLSGVAVGERSVFVTGYRQVGVHVETWDRALVVRRYRSDGEPVWTRRWNPEHRIDLPDPPRDVTAQGEALAVGPHGEVIVLGLNAVDIESTAWFLRAYSSHGELLWSHAPGLRSKPFGFGHPTALAARGDLVVIAGLRSLWPGTEGWLRAYDLDGKLRWSRDVEVPGFGGFSDEPTAVAIGALGNVYWAGWVATSAEYDGDGQYRETDHELVIQKLTGSGRPLWTRVLRDGPAADTDSATSIALRGERLVVAGLVNGRGQRASRLWLGAFTAGGHLNWRRIWEHVPKDEHGPSVAVGDSGSIVVTGARRDPGDHGLDAFVRRFSPSGHLRWTLPLPEDARYVVGTGVAAAGGRAVYVSGYLREPDSERGVGRLWRVHG